MGGGHKKSKNIDSQLLLDGASALGVQHLEGRHDNVLGVSTFQTQSETKVTSCMLRAEFNELKKIEGLLHTLQLLSEHGEENGEVDWAAGLLDHGLQLLILHIQLAYRDTRMINTQVSDHGS